MSLLLKECRWCGNSFVSSHPNGAYCSSKCKDEREKENRKAKPLPVGYRRTKRLLDGVPTTPDVVAATIEHKQNTGRVISYGKTVAIIERSGV